MRGGEREEKQDQARIGILIEPNNYGQQRQRMECVIHDDQIFRSIYDLRLLLSIFFPRYSILSLSLFHIHLSIVALRPVRNTFRQIMNEQRGGLIECKTTRQREELDDSNQILVLLEKDRIDIKRI